MAIEVTTKLEGKYKVTLNKKGAKPHYDSGWFNNLVLDQGLDAIGLGREYILQYCSVGSSSVVPQANDTSLGNRVGNPVVYDNTKTVHTVGTYTPYYGKVNLTYPFAEGAIIGNISEIGIGWGLNSTDLFSRSLIKDDQGNPVTISILEDDILTIQYEFRIYVPTEDTVGNIIIGSQATQFTARASLVTNSNAWGGSFESSSLYVGMSAPSSNARLAYYSGGISSVLGSPTGDVAIGYSPKVPVVSPYVLGNHHVDFTYFCDADIANFPNGIQSVFMHHGASLGATQVEFNPPIPKDNNTRLAMTVRVSWGR